MFPLLETIKCFEGELYNLEFHNSRFNEARKSYFGSIGELRLEESIIIPENCKKGLFRCRITYSPNIEKVEFIPHHFRLIKSLKLVEDNEIDYRYKYADRKSLEQLFQQRDFCDDILIVKNGCITDSYTANPVFFDGNEWFTPDSPLLPGTQRERLIFEKKINSCRVTVADIPKYKLVGLINAMQDLDTMPLISVNQIF